LQGLPTGNGKRDKVYDNQRRNESSRSVRRTKAVGGNNAVPVVCAFELFSSVLWQIKAKERKKRSSVRKQFSKNKKARETSL